MLNFEFKNYLANGSERYGYLARNPDSDSLTTKSAPFPGSLLALLYLDIDGERAPVPEKLTAYYKSTEDEAFQFHSQPMGFEMVYGRDFAEVHCPPASMA